MRFKAFIFFTLVALEIIGQTSINKLTNFRVENGFESRVYFDSSVNLKGTTSTGFNISGKAIIGVSINLGQTTGHYFTVSSGFSFWDNNTIEYEGGSDLDVLEFPLTYIKNSIVEPDSNGKQYFVSSTGIDSNSGLTESTSWRTLKKAMSVASSGSTIWLKAGDYGSESIINSSKGTAINPIKIIGYKNVPGDISSMYYKYNSGNLDPKQMPLFDNSNRGSGTFFQTTGKYIIIENLQFTNYLYGARALNSEGIIIRNCIGSNIGNVGSNGYIFSIAGNKYSKKGRIENCIAINGTMTNFEVKGDFNLVRGCQSYGNESSKGWAVDYYYSLGDGNHNVFIGNYAKRDGNLWHKGHGMNVSTISAVKGNFDDPKICSYNLIENHTAVNLIKTIEFRHGGAHHNVGRRIIGYGEGAGSEYAGSVMFRDGAHDNIIENSNIQSNAGACIEFLETDEVHIGLGSNNIVRNSVFHNSANSAVIRIQNYNSIQAKGINNQVYNNTFYKAKYIFYNVDLGKASMQGCYFENNIVHSAKYYDLNSGSSGWQLKNNNFFNNGFEPKGINSNVNDPMFKDPDNGNFRLKPESLLKSFKDDQKKTFLDYDGALRLNGTIGAFEFEDQSIGSVKAQAGEDQTLCKGESITLKASGGTSYIWSSGETVAEIKVEPSSTTVYTVTVSDGISTDQDEVTVTVNEVTADAGADVTIKQGETVELTASGGDSYLWSTGETTSSITVQPAESLSYSVSVTKNGCTSEDSVKVKVIVEGTIPSVVAQAGEDQTICKGESITLKASGGTSYVWSSGETVAEINVEPSSTTVYTVTVSDGISTDQDEVTVTVNEVTADAGADVTIKQGETVELTASGGDVYLWSTGETTSSITVQPAESVSYSVSVTKNGCTSEDSVKVKVNTPSQGSNSEDNIANANSNSIIDSALEEVSIFPNPTEGLIQLEGNHVYNETEIHIIDFKGSIIYKNSITPDNGLLSQQIDLTGFIKGVYIVRLMNQKNNLTSKIVLL